MAGPAHPQAMASSNPGRTRTSPPERPDTWPSHPRTRIYLLFGASGLFYLLAGMVALRVLWTLGEGPDQWALLLESLANPIYIGFHVISLVSVLFVAGAVTAELHAARHGASYIRTHDVRALRDGLRVQAQLEGPG